MGAIATQRITLCFLRTFSVTVAAALAVAGAAGSAVAGPSVGRTATTADSPAAPPGADDGVTLETDVPQLTAADKDLVVKVRLAGLWEIPAGRMAMTKGVNPRVREIGRMIADQHVKLNELDLVAAKATGVKVPERATAEQRRWLSEMSKASGTTFDNIFVMRLRAAHGKIFPAIGLVRVTTQNDAVRTLAEQANGFVLQHLTFLESTNLVQYAELPPPAAIVTGRVAPPNQGGRGIAGPMIWVILAVALVAGAVASGRVIRPAPAAEPVAPRPRNRPDPRYDPRPGPRDDPRADRRDRPDPIPDPRSRPQPAPRPQPRPENRPDLRPEPRYEPRYEPRGAPRDDPRDRPDPRGPAPGFRPEIVRPVPTHHRSTADRPYAPTTSSRRPGLHSSRPLP